MKQILQLSKAGQLLFFTISFLALSCENKNRAGSEKKDLDILIIAGNTGTHELTLNPSGIAEADKGKKVTWSIAPTAINVKEFKIQKKDTSKGIFTFLDPPPKKYTKVGSGRVDWFNDDGVVYGYSIWWIDNNGKEHEFDPKISVLPSTFDFIAFFITLVLALLILLTLRLGLRKLRNKK